MERVRSGASADRRRHVGSRRDPPRRRPPDGDQLEATDADLGLRHRLHYDRAAGGDRRRNRAGSRESSWQELFDDGDEVVVLEPDIWESVDVVPVALADAPFAIRSAASARIDRAELRAMPLLEATWWRRRPASSRPRSRAAARRRWN